MRINEVQISNDVTILDENGEHSDWVELYNDSDSVVDLSGWGLTDKASKPYKWVFPQNTFINPHGYLTVFADGRENNDVIPPVPLQPNELGDDLVAWFTGDQALESVGTGSRVQQWEDLSGLHNDATNNSTEETRPVVVEQAINGHAALCFQLSEASTMTIGLSRKGSLYFDGQIAEFIMFRRQLTEEEYASVYRYLTTALVQFW